MKKKNHWEFFLGFLQKFLKMYIFRNFSEYFFWNFERNLSKYWFRFFQRFDADILWRFLQKLIRIHPENSCFYQEFLRGILLDKCPIIPLKNTPRRFSRNCSTGKPSKSCPKSCSIFFSTISTGNFFQKSFRKSSEDSTSKSFGIF